MSVSPRPGTLPCATLQEIAGRILERAKAAATVLSATGPQNSKRGLRARLPRNPQRETLRPISRDKDGPDPLLVAARLGKTRLIDNHGV